MVLMRLVAVPHPLTVWLAITRDGFGFHEYQVWLRIGNRHVPAHPDPEGTEESKYVDNGVWTRVERRIGWFRGCFADVSDGWSPWFAPLESFLVVLEVLKRPFLVGEGVLFDPSVLPPTL